MSLRFRERVVLVSTMLVGLVAITAPQEADAQSPPSSTANTCVVPASMLTPVYPGGDRTCWEYKGSSVVINFVLQDATAYGLVEAPYDGSLNGPELVTQIQSTTKVENFTTVCDIVVAHEWAPVKPCDRPAQFKATQLARFKPPSAPTIATTPVPIRKSSLTGHSFQEVLDVAKAKAAGEQCWSALDVSLQGRELPPRVVPQLRMCRAYAQAFGASQWGQPPFQNPIRPSQVGATTRATGDRRR